MEELSRVVLITGASRGIGRAIALRLAEQGHRIAVNYNSHKEDAEKVLEEINKLGSSGIIVKANVSVLDEVQEMIKTVENSLGNIEILYNNAGIISDSLLMRMKPEDFDKVIDTNLKGTFYCTKLCINNMIKNRWGRVINISSTDIRSIRELNLSNPQIMVIDLSFISVTKALPFVMSKVQKDTKMICLIKPQFELSKKQLNKNGIVKNEEYINCLLYTSPSPRDVEEGRMPSSA